MSETAFRQALSWLHWLYGEEFDGQIWIGGHGDGFKGRLFTSTEHAAYYAIELDAAGEGRPWGVYHRLTTMRTVGEGRGRADDSIALPALMQDLDLRGPGHVAGNYPETFADLLALIEDVGMPSTSAWVDSGHGRYSVWRLKAPGLDMQESATAVRELHRAMIDAAAKRGWKIDNTSDLARIYRMPGTTNRKAGEARPVTWVIGEGATEYPLDALKPRESAPAAATPVVQSSLFADAYAPAAVPQSSLFADHSHVSADSARTFTVGQAMAFVKPFLDALASAQDGEINNRLNVAAIALAHFGPEFWGEEVADRLLNEALDETVYDGATWKASDTIASARKSPGWRATLIVETAVEPLGVNLPPSFWESRESLRIIREVANKRIASPDAVLGAVLARVAASLPPECGPDTGVGGTTTSLNMIVGLIGEAGGGKSTAMSAAGLAMPDDPRLNPYAVPLGSGEGMAEAFMGTVEVEDEETFKTKKVRKQVRTGVLFDKDEGAELIRVMERQGSTVGDALRTAWTGGTLGQANGRTETTRIISAGTYSLGIVIGFQPVAAAGLFADREVDVGTPHRFLWLSVSDANYVDRGDVITRRLNSLTGPWSGALVAEERLSKFTIPASVRERVRAERVAKLLGAAEVDRLDTHRTLMTIKVACLLGIMEGRTDSTEEDFALAEQVVSMSDVVRRGILREMQIRTEEEMRKRIKRREHEAAADERGRQQQIEACMPGHMERIALMLKENPAGVSASDVRQRIKHRNCIPDALGQGVEQGLWRLEGRRYLST